MKSNNSKESSGNFYENGNYSAAEKATLAETVTVNGLKPVKAKFFVKVMTPAMETEDPEVKYENGVQNSNYLEMFIPAHLLLSFADLTLESMVHMPDDGEYDHNGDSGNKIFITSGSSSITIPKGTEFLIQFVGGSINSGAAAIIGIYDIPT